MGDNFLYGIFPYIAVVLAVVGGIYRHFSNRFSYSSLSSQLLENRVLFWGSAPWHYGIILVLLDYSHLSGALFPASWGSILRRPLFLFVAEWLGTALALFALFGIVLLILRRILNSKVRVVTSVMDWVLLAILTVQVAAGVWIAIFYRWGSLWYLDTAVPWLRSLGSLSPDYSTISPLPWVIKFHMFNAFVVILLFPFTRLVHIFAFPVTYLWRPYQATAWNRGAAGVGRSGGSLESEQLAPPQKEKETSRRGFLKLLVGVLSALVTATMAVPLIGALIGSSVRSKKPQWVKAGDVTSLPVNQPVNLRFPVETEDAYLRQTIIRDAWVVKHSSSEISVFSPICPHLGCHYDWHADGSEFICPCHGSVYSMTGKVLGGPAPRPLDTLAWKLEGSLLSVQWETFKVGIPQKIQA